MTRLSTAITLFAGLGVLSTMGCLDRGGLDPVDGGGGPPDAMAATGGVSGTGGLSATGGQSASGGAPGSGSGGSVASGGTIGSTGGAAGGPGSGGLMGTGGNAGQGGSPGTGGSSGTGGSGGAGGRGGRDGSGGATGTGAATGSGGATMCPPVCAIFCRYGNVLDAAGCPTCSCKPAPICPRVACLIACEHGYVKNAQGCDTCACNPAPICPGIACGTFCPYGHAKDATGCDTCACNTDPKACLPSDCGSPPDPAVVVCPSTAAGVSAPVADQALPFIAPNLLTCARNSSGKCVWQRNGCQACSAVTCKIACQNGFVIAPDGCPICACNPVPPIASCAAISDAASCAVNPQCIWLQPGCTPPALAAAGCYARTALGCTSDAACGPGRQCLARTINPCPSGNGSMAACLACAATKTICQ